MVEISANVDGILQRIQTVYITGWAEDCHGVKIGITEIFYDVGDRNWQPFAEKGCGIRNQYNFICTDNTIRR